MGAKNTHQGSNKGKLHLLEFSCAQNGFYISNNFYFRIRTTYITKKMKNSSAKKSKNVLEQKRKNGQAKILRKKTHVYNNCFNSFESN